MSYHAGFVGLIGRPNSGKSTLLNALVQEKVAIVTAKPQTTRRRVMGLVTAPDYQIIFVDAPGVIEAESGINRFLRDEAQDVISQSDVLVAVLSIDEVEHDALEKMVNLVQAAGKPWVAVIHKTDLPQAHRPQILRRMLSDKGVPVISGSSLKEPAALREEIVAQVVPLLPPSPGPLYDDELLTLSPMRELASEIIREKCLRHLHQEVPFGMAVRVLLFDEESALLRIHAELIVSKENHRPIVIGRDGQTLKRIGTEARQEIGKLTGRKLFLDLKVTSKANWQKNPRFMKELGYVVQPS